MGSSIEEQIKALEDEIFRTPKNKATEHHLGKLKAKIARLREESEKRKGAKGRGFTIKKSGDATVGIIGFPNVGKSTLLNRLTGASSKIGEYDFTTLKAIPGVMRFKGADIQMLDLPGLVEGASRGRGRGREILSVVRNVDLLLIVVDAQCIDHLASIEKELYDSGIRLNQKIPDVVIRNKERGGISVNSTVNLSFLDESLVKSIASEFVINADITIREDVTEERLIDSFSKNRVYVPAIVVINKIDLVPKEMLIESVKKIEEKNWCVVTISALKGEGLDVLKESIFSRLRFIRVYMKPVGKKIDYEEPLILREGDTVEDACLKLHRDFKTKFRYATVSGPSAKHDVQKTGLRHRLKDKDVLTIVIQRR
jgi:hypothetical protein